MSYLLILILILIQNYIKNIMSIIILYIFIIDVDALSSYSIKHILIPIGLSICLKNDLTLPKKYLHEFIHIIS